MSIQPTDRGPMTLKIKMLKVIQTCFAALPDHSPLRGLPSYFLVVGLFIIKYAVNQTSVTLIGEMKCKKFCKIHNLLNEKFIISNI